MEESLNTALLPIIKEKKPKVRFCKCVKVFLFGLFLFSLSIILFLWYFCSVEACLIGSTTLKWPKYSSLVPFSLSLDKLRRLDSQNGHFSLKLPSPNATERLSDFNIRKLDVIVALQIQNTGASVFLKHLIEDLALEKPCICKRKRRLCRCYRPNRKGSTWLFSRDTVGWKCGVHPDWTELTTCVDGALDEDEGKPLKRRYFFITVLRDPVKRFLSEYWHFRKGITSWKSSRHWCGGKEVSRKDLPLCFDEEDVTNASLEEYLACSYNVAINRQARMLADLTLVNCYDRSAMSKQDRDFVILHSAKNNLHKMAFFGIAELPKKSSYMFELTFGLSFQDREQTFHAGGGKDAERKEFLNGISPTMIDKIRQINSLDIELYEYARQLLSSRFEKVKNVDPEFKDNFELLDKDKLASVDWAEREDTIDNS